MPPVFPDIARDQGQLYRCILEKRVLQFWQFRNAAILKEGKIGQPQFDLVSGIEHKLLFSTAGLATSLEAFERGAEDLFTYARFQYLVVDLFAILEAFAFLADDLHEINQTTQASFGHEAFMKSFKAKAKEMNNLDALHNFAKLLRVFRNAYAHRFVPDYIARSVGHDRPTYGTRLFRDERRSFMDLIPKDGDLWGKLVLLNEENTKQIELHLGAISKYFYETTTEHCNALADHLRVKFADNHEVNADAGAGRLNCSEAQQVFENLLQKYGQKMNAT